MTELLQLIREFAKKNDVDVEMNFYGNIDCPAIVITMRNKRLARSMAFTDFDLEAMEKSGEPIYATLNTILADLIDAMAESLEEEKVKEAYLYKREEPILNHFDEMMKAFWGNPNLKLPEAIIHMTEESEE